MKNAFRGQEVQTKLAEFTGLSSRITAAKALTGCDMSGISRRPVLPDDVCNHLGRNVVMYNDAKDDDCDRFAINYEKPVTTWIPNSVQELYLNLEQRVVEIAKKRQRDNFQVETTPVTTTTTTATTRPASTITCHFGHNITSSVGWCRNTTPSYWTEVPSGVSLCFRCYQRGRRGLPPPPTKVNSTTDTVTLVIKNLHDHAKAADLGWHAPGAEKPRDSTKNNENHPTHIGTSNISTRSFSQNAKKKY